MTGVELILAAIVAGASAGTTETVKGAVLDAYTGLRNALRGLLTARWAQQILDEPEPDPDVLRSGLGPLLEASGAADDADIMAAAREVLALTDPAGTSGGKYQVDAHDARGVQVGDHNVQHNTFSSPGDHA
jgi:hypothetical protein